MSTPVWLKQVCFSQEAQGPRRAQTAQAAQAIDSAEQLPQLWPYYQKTRYYSIQGNHCFEGYVLCVPVFVPQTCEYLGEPMRY